MMKRRAFLTGLLQAGGSGLLQGRGEGSKSVAVDAYPRLQTKFGVNAYDLFLGDLRRGGSLASSRISQLAQWEIPFVRFSASGQWGGEWKDYLGNPGRSWDYLGQIFETAEQNGVGLIPSIFWKPDALASAVGEGVAELSNPRSASRRVAREYLYRFLESFDSSPALMMYEFSNELNDWFDFPNVSNGWPRPDQTMVIEKHENNTNRSIRSEIESFASEFCSIIKSSSSRKISSGYNSPRTNAWNLARGSEDWDSPRQYMDNIKELKNPGFDVSSIHVYPGEYARWGHTHSTFENLSQMLDAFVTSAHEKGFSFVGEFGVPSTGDRVKEEREFHYLLESIASAGVHYAAMWNYSSGLFGYEWDVNAGNHRRYQLDAIRSFNKL